MGGQLILSAATLRNASGPAIHADGLETGDNVFPDDGFTAESSDEDGAVRLPFVRVGGQLSLRSATLRNATTGPALRADRLHTEGQLFLDEGFTAESSGERSVIRLPNARVGGALCTDIGHPRSRYDTSYQWELDGLTYVGVPQPNGTAWLDLLRTGTPRYAAQPYQQLAAAYRADGHDSEVRKVLIAQRRDQIARGGLSRAERWWANTTGQLLGYGYQPWRALLYLAGILILSVGLAVWLGGQGGLVRSTPATVAAAPAIANTPPTATTATTTPGLPISTPTSCTLVHP